MHIENEALDERLAARLAQYIAYRMFPGPETSLDERGYGRDDYAQELHIRAYKLMKDRPDIAVPYLVKSMRNYARDLQRRSRVRGTGRVREGAEVALDSAPSTDDVETAVYRRHRLRRVRERLDGRALEAFDAYYRSHTVDEAAAQLGVSSARFYQIFAVVKAAAAQSDRRTTR